MSQKKTNLFLFVALYVHVVNINVAFNLFWLYVSCKCLAVLYYVECNASFYYLCLFIIILSIGLKK